MEIGGFEDWGEFLMDLRWSFDRKPVEIGGKLAVKQDVLMKKNKEVSSKKLIL